MSNPPLSSTEALLLSPYLATLKQKGRLAPSRLADLLSAACARKTPSAPDDCCGGSCKPCVNELWKQEVRCWDECHPQVEDSSDLEAEDESKSRDEGTPEIEIAIVSEAPIDVAKELLSQLEKVSLSRTVEGKTLEKE